MNKGIVAINHSKFFLFPFYCQKSIISGEKIPGVFMVTKLGLLKYVIRSSRLRTSKIELLRRRDSKRF